MARKTVRIDIPTGSPDKFSKLANDIKAKHLDLGDDSPFKGSTKVNMTDFIARLKDADDNRKLAQKLAEESESAMQKAQNFYGLGKGQSIDTPGTIYYNIDKIKKVLLIENDENEEALSEWGFNVVVGKSKSPKKKS